MQYFITKLGHCHILLVLSSLRYKLHLSRQLNCWSLRCQCCPNYIFIVGLTPGFNTLRKDNCKPRRETFKFWDSVRFILETWQYLSILQGASTHINMLADILDMLFWAAPDAHHDGLCWHSNGLLLSWTVCFFQCYRQHVNKSTCCIPVKVTLDIYGILKVMGIPEISRVTWQPWWWLAKCIR